MKLLKSPLIIISIAALLLTACKTPKEHRKGVNIQARSATGVFYAQRTLAQLARNGKEFPITTIKDKPRFPYRGLHLDVSRHFFNKEYVMKQLDLIATCKINRLPSIPACQSRSMSINRWKRFHPAEQ